MVVAGLPPVRPGSPLSIGIGVVLSLIIPVTALFFTFYSQLQRRSLKHHVSSNVNLSENFLAWVVEGLVRFDVQVASMEFGSAVDVTHLNNIFNFTKIFFI